MGSVKTALFAYLNGYEALTSILSSYEGAAAIFPHSVPQDAELPYIAYWRIADPDVSHLDGACGIGNPSFQFTAYATDPETLEKVSEALRNALDGYAGLMGGSVDVHSVERANEFDDYTPPDAGRAEPKAYTTIMTLELWHARSVPAL